MITTREIEDLLIKAVDANDVKAQEDLNNELNRREALPDEERTMYSADKFADAAAQTTGQPSQMQLNEGDGNWRGSFSGSMVKGGEDAAHGLTQMLYNASPKFMQEARDKVNNYLSDATGGVVRKMPERGGMNEYLRQDEAAFQDARTRAMRTGFDGGRLLGNVFATAPLMAAKPFQAINAGQKLFQGGNIGKGFGQGAAYGMTQPVFGKDEDFWHDKAKQVGVSGGFGAGFSPLGNALSRVVSPKAANQQANLLREEGITPTLGGMLGEKARKFEDKLDAVPILGSAINTAKEKSREELNRAAYQRALPKGYNAKDLPVSPDGVGKIKEFLKSEYNRLLKQTTFKKDKVFDQQLAELKSLAKGLTADGERVFKGALEQFENKLSPNGSLLGEFYKKAESSIGKKASSYVKKGGWEGDTGDILKQLQGLLREQLIRNNPKHAKELKELNSKWANYEIINTASGMAGEQTQHGFSVAQLQSAVKSNKAWNEKGAAGTGKARMQDLSSAGLSVLGSKIPDSGTANRQLINQLMLGAGGVFDFGTALKVAAALGGGSIPYHARKTTADLLTKRPQSAKAFAEALRRGAPVTGASAEVAYDKRNNN
jgi:hypothetical protein